MIEAYHIIDKALPKTQDFKAIKDESLAYLQDFSGSSWTNFNPSDPGITILDQICFALTELGYCIDFPIKDILTNRDGNLEFKEQFYRPDEILTTSPISINDFRKYIIDGIEVVNNALIVPSKYGFSSIGGVYDTYLYVDSNEVDTSDFQKQISLAARYLFARTRNFGESFTLPQLLTKKKYLIMGSIELKSKQDLEKTIRSAQTSINNYIFPAVKQFGYDTLEQEGTSADEIFSGPKLQNGWIETKSLGTKKDEVRITQLITILGSLENVLYVNHLKFQDEDAKRKAHSEDDELIRIDLLSSIEEGHIELLWKNKAIDKKSITSAFSKLRAKTTTHDPKKTVVKTEPELPQGKYREISDYYSIQNTFPEIFGVGENSIEKGSSQHKIARSRQLKGYLTLFDQVIANELEQLSSLGSLFSFKNPMTPAPNDLQNYLDLLDEYERENQEYPVPFLRFSPTYFCRSLYDVPKISSILKNSDVFDYSLELKTEGQQKIDSWKSYQMDPYNSYIHGMMNMLEEESESWNRRNDILDHILARHGESPYIIDEIIAESEYTLNKIQNQVIFKSLYLQNLGFLSYYRNKAYNFLGAKKIKETISTVSEDHWIELNEELSRDFIFQSQFINQIEGLSERDFDNYSGIELKLNLLLGIRAQYRNFIVSNFHDKTMSQKVSQAGWMMKERKGTILIESTLLLESADFQVFVRDSENHSKCWEVGSELSSYDVQKIRCQIVMNQKTILEDLVESKTKQIAGFRLTSKSTERPNDWFEMIQKSGLEILVEASWGDQVSMSINDKVFAHNMTFFVPDFVQYFSTPAFKNSFEYLISDSLSPRISCELQPLNANQLESLISKFSAWHNSLVFSASTHLKENSIIDTCAGLIKELTSIYKSKE
ncbi:MAG: hypothetical protein ABJG68_07470 [Crocinitomicaceae bacterium]